MFTALPWLSTAGSPVPGPPESAMSWPSEAAGGQGSAQVDAVIITVEGPANYRK